MTTATTATTTTATAMAGVDREELLPRYSTQLAYRIESGGGAPIFIHRPRTGSGRWSWYGLVSLPLMVRGVLPPGIQDAR